jgi:hypothetical protein
MKNGLLLSLLFVAFGYIGVHAQNCEHPSHQHSPESCGLIAIPEDQFSFVAPPASYVPFAPRTAVISVTYNGFTPQAQTAFQYAIDIWASVLDSNVPILVNATYTNLGGSVLGFAGAEDFRRNFAGATQTNTWYPIALANKLNGNDLAPGFIDIDATFNSGFTWYFGTDGNCPSGQYDFVTVVLHELCHGLGFLGFGNVSGGLGTVQQLGNPAIYDRFTEDNGGTDLATMPNNSTTLGNALTGNQVYWFGTQGLAQNGGTRPRLYAPGSWDSGSSYSHLNENTYGTGNINSLMTPFLGSAEAIHDPGPIVEGLFTDMGWTFNSCDITDVQIGTQTPCDPATNLYTQEVIVTYTDPPSSGFLSVNGVNFTITSSPQTCIVSLASNGNQVDCNVEFTESAACSFFIDNAWLAPLSCCDNVRIVAVNESTNQITLKNFGTCLQNVGSLQLSSSGNTILVSATTLISGSLLLNPNSSIVIQWNAFPAFPAAGNISLHEAASSITDANKILDFMQWGAAGQGVESTANTAGKWVSGTYITDVSPFSYIGDGLQNGVAFWDGITPPCNISDLSAGIQTPCNEATDFYTQEIIVTYSSAPSTGLLLVNGQSFPILTSPQTIVLTGLPSNGQAVHVQAQFSANSSCSLLENNLFTAPGTCACFSDINNDNETNIQDFLLLLADYGCSGVCSADINGDGTTGAADLLLLNSSFGTDCP